jgi:hypothetical protein
MFHHPEVCEATAIEYGLIAALITCAVVAAASTASRTPAQEPAHCVGQAGNNRPADCPTR